MSRQTEDEGWRGFLSLCAKAHSPEELDQLLWLFLTIEERKSVADRYLIVRELLRGKKTQREIARTLKVSIAKITRGSNFLKTISNNLRRLLEMLLNGAS